MNALETVSTWAARLEWSDVPEEVRHQALRSWVNIVGCAVAGSAHPLISVLERSLLAWSGSGHCSIVGRSATTDVLSATLLNCTSSGVHVFDDTHAQAVVHGSGPPAGALLALSEMRLRSGREALLAFSLGLELAYRLGKALGVAPAQADMRWLQTAITAPFSVAMASGKLMGLNAERLLAAASIALAQSTGMRTATGQSWARISPGETAQFGLKAAFYAEQGIRGGLQALDGPNGFLACFSTRPHLPWLVDDLGERWEILDNTFKPYPSGVVINPVIEACMALHAPLAQSGSSVRAIELLLNPMAIQLTNQPHPDSVVAAQVRLQHWAAVVLVDGQAGLMQIESARLTDPQVSLLRERVQLVPDESMPLTAARVVVRLEDGTTLQQAVSACLGSATRPMTDKDIDQKFLTITAGVLGSERAGALLQACRGIESLPNAAAIAQAARLPG